MRLRVDVAARLARLPRARADARAAARGGRRAGDRRGRPPRGDRPVAPVQLRHPTRGAAHVRRDRVLAGDPRRPPAAEFPERPRAAPPLRVEADAEQLDRGLARLVLAILELVRQLLERQAVRRMEGGSLSDAEMERLGRALQLLKQKLAELPEELDVDR